MKRYICDGIVKGATHVRNQMPCQDNKKIVEISDQIAIVCQMTSPVSASIFQTGTSAVVLLRQPRRKEVLTYR